MSTLNNIDNDNKKSTNENWNSSASSTITDVPAEPILNDASTEPTSSDPEKSAALAFGSDAPDGGVTAWLVVFGVWCTSFCSFGWINSIGAFQEYYQNDFLSNYSPSTVSWIPSLQIFFMSALGPVVGAIYDRHGPRHLLIVGTFLHVFGLMMASLAREYYSLLLAQGVCSAIGVACVFQPALSTIMGWFSTRRGTAFGILSTGSSLGGVVFPIMVTRLIREIGFAWAMRTCAFIILGVLIMAILTVRNFKPPQPQKMTRQLLSKPFREPEFVLLLLGFFLFTYGLYVPITYLQVQALAAGMRPNLAEYIMSIFNAASLFGRLSSGIVGDKIGRYNVFIIVCYLSGIWALALWIPSSGSGGLIAFAVLFGFCSGAYVSLIAALVAQISPLSEIGFRNGLVFLTSSIGGLTTSPINGAILEKSGFIGVKIFSGVFCIAGTTFILAARIHRTGWKLNVAF